MRANRARDTGPELRLRRALHALGFRYRVNALVTVPGCRVRPDLVFSRRRVAVFVDGCYWHACAEHGRRPSDPTGYWAAKLEANVARDARVNEALRAAGWRVVRVWEHVDVADAIALVAAEFASEPPPGRAVGSSR